MYKYFKNNKDAQNMFYLVVKPCIIIDIIIILLIITVSIFDFIPDKSNNLFTGLLISFTIITLVFHNTLLRYEEEIYIRKSMKEESKMKNELMIKCNKAIKEARSGKYYVVSERTGHKYNYGENEIIDMQFELAMLFYLFPEFDSYNFCRFNKKCYTVYRH